MTTTTATNPVEVSPRRARFREAVANLAGRAKSSELQRMLLLPGSLLVAAGFAFMIAGWWGASHTHRQVEQIPYLISGGIIGLALTLLGGMVLTTAVWTALVDRLTIDADERAARQLAELGEALRPAPVPEPEPPTPTPAKPARPTRKRAASTASRRG